MVLKRVDVVIVALFVGLRVCSVALAQGGSRMA